MGSALAFPFAQNSHDVRLVGSYLDEAIIGELQRTRRHPALDVEVPESVRVYREDQLAAAVDGADVIVLATHSLGVDWALMMLRMYGPIDAHIVLAGRGMSVVDDQPLALHEAVAGEMISSGAVITLAGPLLADDLVRGNPVAAVLAGDDASALNAVAAWLRTERVGVSTSPDWRGVALSAALVNLYAIALGMGAQCEMGVVFTQSLREMAYLVEQWGGEPESVLGLAGAGDLYATAAAGRHRALGEWLARGLTYTDARVQQMPDATLEGAELALAVGAAIELRLRNGELDPAHLPLLHMLFGVICNDQFAQIPWGQLSAT